MSVDRELQCVTKLSKRLLVISPHFKLFIKDQIIAISNYFANVSVLVPHPYFPYPFLSVPLFEKRLLFLENAMDSCKTHISSNIDSFYPRFFTLPIEIMRKRAPLISAASSTKMLKKKSIKFDLVHIHRLDVGFTGAVIKENCGKPFVVTCHGSDVYDFPFKDEYRHSIAKYTLNKVDHVIAASKSEADKLLSLGLDSRKLSQIPNGFDDALFSPVLQKSARAELGLPLNKKILLSVATLDEVKGHIYLIRAMHTITKIRSDVIAVIIGSGPLEEKLRKEITKLGLTEKVLLIGREPHNRIPSWINASDIFLLPSLNEGFPTVIPEAMACGKPIIGTNVGGIPDAISDEDIGILVNAADPEALAQAILDSLSRKWPSERICESAQKYSLRTITEQILSIYQDVLGKYITRD